MLLWVWRQVVGSDARTLLPRLGGRGVGRKVDPDFGPRRVCIPCQGRDSVSLELSAALQAAIARGQWVTIAEAPSPEGIARVRHGYSFNSTSLGGAVLAHYVDGCAANELYRGEWSLREVLVDLPSAALV